MESDPMRQRGADGHEPLGDVARDVMDHVGVILRDRARIARLEAQRFGEHVKHDVAPRALFGTAAAVCALVAAVCGLLALFLGIAWAIGSVAWTFLIFAVLFCVGAAVFAGTMARRPTTARETAEAIARRFPAARSEAAPEHALVRQEAPEAHREDVVEARREAETGADSLSAAPASRDPRSPAPPAR